MTNSLSFHFYEESKVVKLGEKVQKWLQQIQENEGMGIHCLIGTEFYF